jgi:hypothetical protein
MKTKDYENKLSLKLLGFLREVFDEVEVVERLIEWGFTYEEIIELGFSLETLKKAQKEINKGLITD